MKKRDSKRRQLDLLLSFLGNMPTYYSWKLMVAALQQFLLMGSSTHRLLLLIYYLIRFIISSPRPRLLVPWFRTAVHLCRCCRSWVGGVEAKVDESKNLSEFLSAWNSSLYRNKNQTVTIKKEKTLKNKKTNKKNLVIIFPDSAPGGGHVTEICHQDIKEKKRHTGASLHFEKTD